MQYEQGDTVSLFNGMQVVIVKMDDSGAVVADVRSPDLRFYVEHADIGETASPVLLRSLRGVA